MSTHVTVAVAKPNHLPVMVYTESKVGEQWIPSSENVKLKVGEVQTFLVHSVQRVIIEECKD